MQHLNVSGNKGDEAVSPVVGVMLMLVVVIIIAAVVSGFAGGLVGETSQKAPTLTMDVKVVNMGSWTGSGFFATVTGVSKPIPTGDIRIVTSWTAANGGSPVSGGNTTLPGQGESIYLNPRLNTYYLFGGTAARPFTTFNSRYNWIAPWGGGPGVNASDTVGYGDTNPTTYGQMVQQFGYYTLVPGTTMTAKPYGQGTPQTMGGTIATGGTAGTSGGLGYGVVTPYKYTLGDASSYTRGGNRSDSMGAVLGYGWETLREGDKVNIKVIHSPTGKVIFNKDVPVTEG
ncbi:type IV pilin [Methanoregula sp.]|uniref:type IV pilin n=1 Tax=Methanoregula sp. TaxID=2052170 RepID=UPI002371927F|nr:type IV pilin [Methanoregula sp.]MDD1687872.1 type IV pilin [Methanoregula sp.]